MVQNVFVRLLLYFMLANRSVSIERWVVMGRLSSYWCSLTHSVVSVSQDQLATEMYNFVARESEYSELLIEVS